MTFFTAVFPKYLNSSDSFIFFPLELHFGTTPKASRNYRSIARSSFKVRNSTVPVTGFLKIPVLIVAPLYMASRGRATFSEISFT
jgi:hypothetical protein